RGVEERSAEDLEQPEEERVVLGVHRCALAVALTFHARAHLTNAPLLDLVELASPEVRAEEPVHPLAVRRDLVPRVEDGARLRAELSSEGEGRALRDLGQRRGVTGSLELPLAREPLCERSDAAIRDALR